MLQPSLRLILRHKHRRWLQPDTVGAGHALRNWALSNASSRRQPSLEPLERSHKADGARRASLIWTVRGGGMAAEA